MLHSSYIVWLQLLFKATKQCIAIWTIVIITWRCNIYYRRKQTMWQKNYTNKIVGVAIESPTYSNTTICFIQCGGNLLTLFDVLRLGEQGHTPHKKCEPWELPHRRASKSAVAIILTGILFKTSISGTCHTIWL